MLGYYDEKTNDVRFRDIAEYATMVMLTQTMDDLKKQGKKVTPSMMQTFRDNWMRDGKPMDFETMRPKPSDFVRLLKATGAKKFGKLDEYKSLEEGIIDIWKKSIDFYDKQAKQGNHLHVITDPVIREHVLHDRGHEWSKAIFIHKGKSVRMLNPGDAVTLVDRTNASITYKSKVAAAVQKEAGFKEAPLPKKEKTSKTSTSKEKGFKDVQVAKKKQQTKKQSPTPTIRKGEIFAGWNGGFDKTEGRELRGLADVLGAYFTKADVELIAKNIDPTARFDAQYVNSSLALLKHMRSKGYDFSFRDNGHRNQIEVRMNTGENVNVRVFDTDKEGSLIGRVYDAYNIYYYNVMGSDSVKQSTTFTPEDSMAVLDYVMGHKTGRVVKTVSKDTSRVHLEGVDHKKSVQVVPVDDRYRSLIFAGKDEAKDYIETAIQDATDFVQGEFKAEALQALIDGGLDDEDTLVTSPAFQAKLEALYSNDVQVREAQERAVSLMLHSDDGGLTHLEQARDRIVGDYENGFNPAFVVDHMKQTDRGNERDAMMAALKTVQYDLSKIKGNDFAVNAMRERLITFDPESAKTIDDVTHPMLKHALKTVQDTLKAGGFIGEKGYGSEPVVQIDDNGIIRWEGNRKTGSKKKDKMWQPISGEIGQIMVPDEHGVIQTKFQGGSNYGLVPGYTGYFAFDGDYKNRMDRFRVKGFEQHVTEQLVAQVNHQMTRPFDQTIQNIPTVLDSSGLNGLYHGDVYGKRIELYFMETSPLNNETKRAILHTLKNRVRFDNQYSDYATTSAETQAKREYGNQFTESSFSYWQAAGETNMRVLNKDLENIADLTMTGTGKTQGLIWYLTDGTVVNKDGSVTPSKGILKEDGTVEPDKTALQKLPYFDKKEFNAWDRNQMAANQLMTALKVDEKVNTALMAFGGWTFDDSYAVSKEFAERNKVFGSKPNEESMRVLQSVIEQMQVGTIKNYGEAKRFLDGTGMIWSERVLAEGLEKVETWNTTKDAEARMTMGKEIDAFFEEHGRFRPLQRGDKLSDFGGNKGTIGIVIDRNLSPEEAKAQNLEKEVRFLRANPKLDVISAPYSMLSRHNAGVVKELMSGEVQDLVDPDSGEVFKGAMGQLNIIVTDMKVDEKTHAYSREDVLEGKGRKASGQLAWALQSKDAKGILNEIYGRNDGAWSTFREYLIATGLDMKPDGTIVNGYTPHADEERHHFAYEEGTDAPAFLDKIKDQGGFLDIPFEVEFKNGNKTNSIPVLSASLRQNVELIDGSMRRSDFTNYYANIYQALGEYEGAETEAELAETEDVREKAEKAREKAKAKVQDQFDKIQATIIDRQFDGGHNGKHSFIRDKIMGKRMQHSATGVAVVDPRLNIGEAGMNQDMMDALNAKEGDIVMAFRDPVWRDGAIRAMKVVKDDSVHGISINPIADKSHDMDFDGDTMGLMKFDTKQANDDLVNKFSHWANMIDHGNGKDELYFQTGMDLASAAVKAEKAGDDSPKRLYERAVRNAKSPDKRLWKQSFHDLNKYSHKLFREYGFGGDFVSLTNDETVFKSFKQMVDNGAKGNASKLAEYKAYHQGKKTDRDAREIQYATGVKSDDTGLAGAFSQKLVSVMRNQNITAALESMYPLTQGTLQIKHDANHARTVNEILTEDMNRTFRGKDVRDAKKTLTPKGFKAQLTDVLENKMLVNVNEKFIDGVTETLTHNGKLLPLKEAMALKGSPMDRVAYGGGYDELQKLAEKEESLLEGKQNKLFAPFTMRNADEKTKLVKKDTQRALPKKQAEPERNVEVVFTAEEDAGIAL